MNDWDDFRYFLAVVRTGSVTAAANELDVNHSTVSRRIVAFEKRLGVRLFDRLPSGYAPTLIAEDAIGDAQKVEKDIAAVSRKLASQDMRMTGTLRITSPEGIIFLVVMPHLTAFSEMYPGIKIEIIATEETKNLNNREVDLAIRATNRPPEGLVGRKLTEQGLGKYASRDYLTVRGINPHPREVKFSSKTDPGKHAWIGLSREKATPDWVALHYPEARCAASLDSYYSIFHAVKSGLGIAELPCRVGNADPMLIRVPPLETIKHRDIWLLYHRDMRHTAKLRAFSDFFTKVISAERKLFVQ